MTRSSILSVLIGMSVFLSNIHDAFAQANACVDIQGTWISPYGTYFLNQSSGGTITGTHTTNGKGNGLPCAAGTEATVNGNFGVNGAFSISVPNVYQANGALCYGWTANGTVSGAGCMNGADSFDNNDNSSGSESLLLQSCNLPSGETTTPMDPFWDLVHSEPTVGIFRAVITPSNYGLYPFNYGGRTFTETFPNGGIDGCYFAGNGRYMLWTPTAAQPFTFTADENNTYDDRVGVDGDVVEWYRLKNRAPCSFQTLQNVNLDCNNGAQWYAQNSLIIQISDTTVTVDRDRVGGSVVSVTEVWGTSQTAYKAAAIIGSAFKLLLLN